jgi:hypothetical protein
MAPDAEPLSCLWIRNTVNSAVSRTPSGGGSDDPLLPPMRRGFTTPCDTSHPHTTAQVSTAVKDCIVRRSEAARSMVSGEFLARQSTRRCWRA